MHTRIAWWLLLLPMLLIGSAAAEDAGTQQEHEIVKQVVVSGDAQADTEEACVVAVGGSPSLVGALHMDKLEDAGQRLKEAMAQLRESGDLTAKGQRKLEAVLEEIAAGLARLGANEHQVTVLKRSGAPGTLDGGLAVALENAGIAAGEAGQAYAVTLEQLAGLDGATAESGAREAYAVALKQLDTVNVEEIKELVENIAVQAGGGNDEAREIVIKLQQDGGEGVKLLNMRTGEDGEWIIENEGFDEEVVERLKQHEAGELDIRVLEDTDGKNLRIVKDGKEITWNREAGLAAPHALMLEQHDAGLDKWFEGWGELVEDLSAKLDAQDIDRIHEKLEWLKDHMQQARQRHPGVMMVAPDGAGNGLSLSPGHREKLMRLHELQLTQPGGLDGEWFERMHGEEWLQDHQKLLEHHQKLMEKHGGMALSHDALLEEIEALVEELVKKYLEEHEQKAGRSV